MAISKSKKKRLHAVRNGKLDPGQMRGDSADFSTHVRKTPSKQERINKSERKYGQGREW